jgi:integrase
MSSPTSRLSGQRLVIEKRKRASGATTYRTRYYGPDRQLRSRSFSTRRDAVAFQAQMKAEQSRGEWIDPRRGKIPLNAVWDLFAAGQGHLELTTRANYRSAWGMRVQPQFGTWPINRIGHSDIAGWVQTMQARGDKPDSIRYAHRVLSLLLDLAVRDRRLHKNDAKDVHLPKVPPARKRFLTVRQVHDLAEALDAWPVTENERRRAAYNARMDVRREKSAKGISTGEEPARKPILSLLAVRPGYGSDAVRVFAYCGLRWSELAALRVCDVDLAAHRLSVVERTTEIGGRLDTAAPKSKKARQVAIPRSVARVLEARIEGRPPNDLVFTIPRGQPLRNLNWRRDVRWNQVCTDLGLDGLTPHDLRRTFGSLARLAGADLKYIQKAMGHSSITVTAEIYAQLFDSELDKVSDALDALTEGVAESVYAQNTPTGPDPESDRTL